MVFSVQRFRRGATARMVPVLTPFFKDDWASEGDLAVELGLTLPAATAVSNSRCCIRFWAGYFTFSHESRWGSPARCCFVVSSPISPVPTFPPVYEVGILCPSGRIYGYVEIWDRYIKSEPCPVQIAIGVSRCYCSSPVEVAGFLCPTPVDVVGGCGAKVLPSPIW